MASMTSSHHLYVCTLQLTQDDFHALGLGDEISGQKEEGIDQGQQV